MKTPNSCLQEAIDEMTRLMKEEAPRDSLYSLSIVGSFANPNHAIELVNDIDFLFIYDDYEIGGKRVRIMRDIYESICELNNKLVDQFSNSVEIIPCYECGPFKPPPDGKSKIELHNIIYTINRWLREEPTFLFDRSRLHKLLYGEPPGSIYDVKHISKHAVIRDLYGIDHCSRMIKTRRIKYCIWEPDPTNDKVMKISIEERNVRDLSSENLFTFLEFLFYSVIRSSVNSVRTVTQEAHFYRQDCITFVKKFKNLEMKDLLLEVLNMKDKLRNNRLKINEEMAEELSTQVLLYLEKLRSELEEMG